jgi:type IV pilus assembly protein PilA
MNVHPGPGAPQPKQSKSAVWIIVVILAVVGGCCVMGILAAIAVPNFIKYQSRSKQAECNGRLRKIYLAQKDYFEAHQTYATDFNALGHSPDARRYTYFLAPASTKSPTTAGVKPVNLDQLPALAGGAVVGIEGPCPDCIFTAVCASNADADEDLDVWSISTAARGELQAGEVSHDLDDLK